LNLDITDLGSFVFIESNSAISDATNTVGIIVDSISMNIYWQDLISNESLAFNISAENATLNIATYNYDKAYFEGSVNF
jgi:hypothetical protein